MQLACCQFDIAWENKSANYAKAFSLLRAANIPRGSLVLLPEMFACGFSMNVAAVSDDQSHADQTFLAQLARQHQVFLIGGFVTNAPAGRGRNQAGVFDPEGRAPAGIEPGCRSAR